MKLNNKKGFTLVELLIVIAILAVLAALMIPQFVGMIERARDATIAAELRTAATRAAIINIDTRAFTAVNCVAGDAEIMSICGSIIANSPATALASYSAARQYCISAELNYHIGENTHWCIDHTGFSGRVAGVQCGVIIHPTTTPRISCR